jgi:hypothetical protein
VYKSSSTKAGHKRIASTIVLIQANAERHGVNLVPAISNLQKLIELAASKK